MPTSKLIESLLLLSSSYGGRQLQEIPDYTSPPLPIALEATPEDYRSDAVTDEMRAVAGAGNCTATEDRCHIPFVPPADGFEGDSQVGVIFYPGALVDPRGYSVVANLLATRYGFPTVIPVFNGDLAFTFGICDSGRLDFAQAEFPSVEKWILAGHSFGGVAAMVDMWSRWNEGDERAAGLVMLASYIQSVGCGDIDFSNTTLPMANVFAYNDEIVNITNWEQNQVYLSNNTEHTKIYGANHGQFGAYDDSGRFEALGQVDGEAVIPSFVVWDFIGASVASVASRVGVPMPVRINATAPAIENDAGEDSQRCPPDLSDSGVKSLAISTISSLIAAALLCFHL